MPQETKFVVNYCELDSDKMAFAQNVLRTLILSGEKSTRVWAKQLKQQFDDNYGATWHCVIGSSYGTMVSHLEGSYVYFYVDNQAVLLFKSVTSGISTVNAQAVTPKKTQSERSLLSQRPPTNISEDSARIAKLRSNRPKPRELPANEKEQRIKQGLMRGKSDYPTMNDVMSDWESMEEKPKKN